MLSSFCSFWLEIVKPLSIRNISPKYEFWLKFYLNNRQNMTNWLKFFLAFYILVGQPALLGWMLDNCGLYQLAWLNAWVFIIARIISALCKPNKSAISKDNTAKVIEKSEEKISRIENDNGVAVVSVEKKQEVVVETAKNEDQGSIAEWLVENNEEKLEEKIEEKPEENPEEKTPERPMRENVTIPKIVQPLTWHHAPKKKKKDWKWWQWLILFITLWIAAIIAWTLREFLGKRWIAIALFLWWILYLVIGKLFDVNGFYNAKKLFTNRLYIILILAWVGYGIYAMQQENKSFLPAGFSDKVSSYIKDRFTSNEEKNTEIGTWDEIYIFEWTGEVISDSWTEIIDLIENTWVIENEVWEENALQNEETTTETTENSEPEEVAMQPEVITTEIKEEQKAPTLSPEEANKKVTMWEAIKSLLAWATLSTKTNVTFKYVARSNELYPYFKTAQEKRMIGTDTDPNKLVSCDTYITLKWLREWRNVWYYTKNTVKSAYWDKAAELWKLNWCKKWVYVTKANL